jgi:hypothetical protein
MAPRSRCVSHHHRLEVEDNMTADPMPIRSVRVPTPLWLAAKACADVERVNLSQVIRDALTAYVRLKDE